MAWCTINGIELARVAALADPPTGDRRDIGSQVEAGDGSLIITRQSRKRDLKFRTKPLSRADAHAWEGLLVGESSVWPFEAPFNLYSCKGEPSTPSTGAPDVEVQATVKKYGAGALKVVVGEEWYCGYPSGLQLVGPWTLSCWVRVDAGTFVHRVHRSDGVKWADAVRGDLYAFSPGVSPDARGVTLYPPDDAVTETYFDDLVVSPFLWPEDWPAQVFAAGRAFGLTPYITAAGNLVPEATTRRMACKSMAETVMIANLGAGAGLERDVRQLSFDLAGA